MAQQCFINEYVFDQTPDETAAVARQRDSVTAALAAGAAVAPARLAVLAAYVPLHTVDGIDAILSKSWPQPLDALISQQLREPLEERDIRAAMPALTPIDDGVSMAVRQQYEENPYPRWVMAPAVGAPVRIEDVPRSKLPNARIENFPSGPTLDILIAGCGTGRHTVETARLFADTRIQCVDLSLASLAYAARKTRELGLTGIDYAQADILKLGGLGRTFDVIEFERRAASSGRSVRRLAGVGRLAATARTDEYRGLQRRGPARRHGRARLYRRKGLCGDRRRHPRLPPGFSGASRGHAAA